MPKALLMSTDTLNIFLEAKIKLAHFNTTAGKKRERPYRYKINIKFESLGHITSKLFKNPPFFSIKYLCKINEMHIGKENKCAIWDQLCLSYIVHKTNFTAALRLAWSQYYGAVFALFDGCSVLSVLEMLVSSYRSATLSVKDLFFTAWVLRSVWEVAAVRACRAKNSVHSSNFPRTTMHMQVIFWALHSKQRPQ